MENLHLNAGLKIVAKNERLPVVPAMGTKETIPQLYQKLYPELAFRGS
jgi:hypothetical protein